MSNAVEQDVEYFLPADSDQKRYRRDRYATWIFKGVGASILLSLLAIVGVLSLEIVPLFHPVSVEKQTNLLITDVRTALFHENVETALLIGEKESSIYAKNSLATAPYHVHNQASRLVRIQGREELLRVSEDSLAIIRPHFVEGYEDGTTTVQVEEPTVHSITRLDSVPVSHAAVATREGDLYALLTERSTVHLVWFYRRRALIGGEQIQEKRTDISIPDGEQITALALQGNGRHLVLGTQSGKLLLYSLKRFSEPELLSSVFEDDVARSSISSLLFLLGEQKLIVASERGSLTAWHMLRSGSAQELVPVFHYAASKHPIVQLSRSMRKRTFLAVDSVGNAVLMYGTDGRVLWEGVFDSNHSVVHLDARGDAIVSLGTDSIQRFDVYNPYPEVSMKSLFGELWYEGSREPEYFWQSSGASDAVESKLSLVPLMYGTFKGTFYALLFSLPLALGGALYTSEFMHPALKDTIKPIMELMAAFPSVVIGFIAGLWLAPVVYPHLLGVMLVPCMIFIFVVLAFNLHSLMVRIGLPPLTKGLETLFLIPVLLVSMEVSFVVADIIQDHLFGGDFTLYLFRAMGVAVDQRNSFIAGIAVGFVVIPVVFTIAEDCLSRVPKKLRAAALALGATPWETACTVVLPIALPGIFSAVMLGVGRAIGETMIVLMATGNTAIMELSPFNGFRALSATIAVELPEAPYGSALYRVLFVAAFILFVATFLLNIVSELIRRKLRKSMEQL